jgi:hypothetical protein
MDGMKRVYKNGLKNQAESQIMQGEGKQGA